MPTYASLIEVDDRDVQNPQEFASIWGEIETELTDHDAQLLDSYAVLGECDFLTVFEVSDRKGAFETSMILGRHGLSARTMSVVDTDDFAHLVDDV